MIAPASQSQAPPAAVGIPTPAPPAPTPASSAGTQGALEYLCEEQDHLTDVAKSPVAVYLRSLYKGFSEYRHQAIIAAVALAVGALCSWDGPRVWQALFTATMVAGATSLARIESEAWELDMFSELLLMFQAAFATGVAIQSGFDGFQVLFGTVVGFVVCYGIGGWARQVDHWGVTVFALLWYTAGAMLGALVLTIWQRPVLVTLGPLLGGFLVTTGLECMACLIAGAVSKKQVSVLPPFHEPWIHIARDLLFVLGPGAFAFHGACAVIATIVYRVTVEDDRRFPAVCCIVAFIVVAAIMAAVNGNWWVVCACLLWLVTTGLATYRQLGLLADWVPRTLREVVDNFGTNGFASIRSDYDHLPSNRKDNEVGDNNPFASTISASGGLGAFLRRSQ